MGKISNFSWMLVLIFLVFMISSCKQREVEFCLEKKVLLNEIPQDELVGIGFSIYYKPESLSSNLNVIPLFQYLNDDISIEDFDFENFAYVFTFGHRINGYKLLYKKMINGKAYNIIELNYFDETTPYVYIYKISRYPRILCEMG